jgi:hypothetical protein
MALLLDLSNIVGGFLLAAGLLRRAPRLAGPTTRAATTLAPFTPVVGVVALVAGGYYLIVHLTSGPHVFHFEVVGIAVGLALLRDRLTRRPSVPDLLLAVLGLIAIVVGIQGLFTPN